MSNSEMIRELTFDTYILFGVLGFIIFALIFKIIKWSREVLREE